MLIIATLIFLGILLMFIEFLLTPGVGIAGILSLASFIASCWFGFTDFGTTTGVVLIIINICIVLIIFLIMLRSKTWKKFQLESVIDAKVNQEGDTLKVGDTGKAITRLAPSGTAEIEGITCEVSTLEGMIDAGTSIEVSSIKDKKIIVKTLK